MAKKNNSKKIKNITPRQRQFCRYYALTNNAVEAARQAGYANPQAHANNLVKRIAIKELTYKLRDQIFAQYKITNEYCISKLKDILEIAIQKKDLKNANETMDRIIKFIHDDNLLINENGKIQINIIKE